MEIRDISGKVLFSDDSPTIRETLENAVRAGANLSRAYLSRARGLPVAPVVKDLDAAIVAAIQAGGRLEMKTWHTCQTTHCLAGWAIVLAGEAGAELEKELGPNVAGALIYAASRPGVPVPNFYASNNKAMEDLMKGGERIENEGS